MENVEESETVTSHCSKAESEDVKESTNYSIMEKAKGWNSEDKKSKYSFNKKVDDEAQDASHSDKPSLKRGRTQSPSDDKAGYFVTLDNIPEAFNFKDVRGIIMKSLDHPMNISRQEMLINGNGPNSFIIRFAKRDLSEKAIKNLNGKEVMGQNITARHGKYTAFKTFKYNNIKEKITPPYTRNQSSSSSKFDMKSKNKIMQPNQDWDKDIKETYGLNRNFLQELGITIMRKNIFVTNLDTSVETEKLREVFSNAGEIVNIHVIRNAEVAFARIEYDHPLEAVQAISMFHRRELNGRNLNVRMDYKKDPVIPPQKNDFGPGLGEFGAPLRHIYIMREIQSLRENFTREIRTLQNEIEVLNSKLMSLSNMSNLGPMQQTNMQNSTPMINLNSSQYMPLGNMFNNQTVNSSMFQNMMPNTNMQMMQNQTAQINQISGQMGLTSGQMNQLSGWMGQTTGQMGLTSGHLNQSTGLAGQTTDQMGQTSGYLNQSTGMIGQTTDQMGQTSGYLNQSTGMIGQTTDQMGQTSGYLNQSTGMIGQTTDQMGQKSGYLNQSTGMIGQTTDQMGQTSGYLNQSTGMIGQTTDQMGQTTGLSVQTGQMVNQLGQPVNQMGQTMNQLGQPLNKVGQLMNQLGRSTSQMMNPMTNQTGQMINHMSEKRNHVDSENTKRGRSADQDDYMYNQINNMAGRSHENKYSGNNYQYLNPESSESNKSKPSDMVIFKNLPRSINERMLISKMKTVGEIKFAEMTGHGKAIVRFMNSQSSARCIELFHRSRVDGKTIDVEYL